MSAISRLLGMTTVAMLVSATGFAQAPPQAPGVRGPRARGFMAGVNLTDAQRDQIRTLRQEHQTAVRDQAQQLRDAQRALHEEVFADSPDAAKIDSLQQQVGSLSQQLRAARLELQQKIAQVLTPEQRKIVRERRAQLRAFRAGRMMERRLMQRRRPRAEF